MANTYITSSSRFKPYTFAEMLQPVQIYTEASNAVETELSNLDVLANDIVGKLNPNDPEDAKTLETYKAFKTQMDNALESFYKNGLTPESKKALASLKSQYSKDINPINTAYERRVKDLDLIRQMKLSNPYIVIEGIGKSTSAYMNGNTPEPIVVDLYKASEAAKNASIGLSKQFIEQIGLRGVEGYIGQYLMHGVQKGIDSTMVADFTDYVDAIKKGQNKELQTPQGLALSNMFEQIRTANNYDNLSKDAKDRLDASIVQGLVSGAAADEDIKYMADNYWDVEAKKQSIDYTKARMQALRDKSNTTDTDLDLRTNTTIYTGKNFDVAKIADLMGEQFKEPVEYNGTKIYDPIQAYNIIHKDDARIAEIARRLDREEFVVRNVVGKKVDYDSRGFNKSVYVGGKVDEALTKSLREYERLIQHRKDAYSALDGIALTDEEVSKIREYSKSSSTGMLTQAELTNFATKLESDFTAYSGAEKTATIFSKTNSKDGLEDMVLTISDNLMPSWRKGHTLKVTDSAGNNVSKDFEKLINAENGIDVNKVSSISLDFTAAERGAVKLTTTDGKVYYVDSDYIGDQANNFIKGETGLFNTYQQLMSQSISKTSKAEILNSTLGTITKSIQSQYTKNRDKSMSPIISDALLFGEKNTDLDIED